MSKSTKPSRPNALSLSIAVGLLLPVSTVCTVPSSLATAASASVAPGSSWPWLVSSWCRAARAVASSALNGSSMCSASPPARMSTPFSASASTKISDSDRPAICGSWTSGRPAIVQNASAQAALVARATSTRVRSIFHRTRRWRASADMGVLSQVRVPVVGGGYEEFLDRAGGDPADQVEHRAGLVVGAAGPGAAEGLLADDGAGGLVVDVEVA